MDEPQNDKSIAKTFVRGSYLYLQNGQGYQQGHKDVSETEQKVIKDTLGIYDYHKELKQKKLEVDSKRRNMSGGKGDRPTLIPIRDTPVDPIPESTPVYQKCQRSTQEQFEYFQSYVNLKEKQRKFEDEEKQQLEQFLEKQRKMREYEIQNPPQNNFQLVMEKQEQQKPKKTKKIVKMKIKKKQQKV